MQKPFFSIIVVSLNPGEKLEKTLNNIMGQTFKDYEVILKDGGSTDGSLEKLQKQGYFEDKNQIRIIQREDRSIYDGMNQAVPCINGRYVQFLNCGDYFYSKTVLEEVVEFIEADRKKKNRELLLAGDSSVDVSEVLPRENGSIKRSDSVADFAIEVIEHAPVIYYGNQYNQLQNTIVYSAPQINDFTCYRNVPCHQVCFYDYRLFEKRAYELKYKVRADYEHFLYSIYGEKAMGISMPIIIASYEGGGFSETRENRRQSAVEHKEITKKYLGKAKVFKYQMIMWLTLAPLRTWIAENPALSGIYNAVKSRIYKLLRK